MVYRGRERRTRRRVVLKAYLRAQRTPARAAALRREQEMLRLAGPHAGVVALDRVLEVLRRSVCVRGAARCGAVCACPLPCSVRAVRRCL